MRRSQRLKKEDFFFFFLPECTPQRLCLPHMVLSQLNQQPVPHRLQRLADVFSSWLHLPAALDWLSGEMPSVTVSPARVIVANEAAVKSFGRNEAQSGTNFKSELLKACAQQLFRELRSVIVSYSPDGSDALLALSPHAVPVFNLKYFIFPSMYLFIIFDLFIAYLF